MVPRKPRKLNKRVFLPGFERGTSVWKHCPALREGRAAFCCGSVMRIKARSWQHQRAPQHGSGSTNAHHITISGAPIFFALPSARAGQCSAHQTAPSRTKPHQASTNTHQILPCPPQGQGSLLGAIIFGPKIQLKFQFNSFLHQIKSPSKSQNPRIESV